MDEPLEVILTIRLKKSQIQTAIKEYLAKRGHVFGDKSEYEYVYDENTREITQLIICESRMQEDINE